MPLEQLSTIAACFNPSGRWHERGLEAEDTRLRRHIALKVLPERIASDLDSRARFEREAQAVAALNHPNIVTIHSVEECGSTRFLTMEIVDGRTIETLDPRTGFERTALGYSSWTGEVNRFAGSPTTQRYEKWRGGAAKRVLVLIASASSVSADSRPSVWPHAVQLTAHHRPSHCILAAAG